MHEDKHTAPFFCVRKKKKTIFKKMWSSVNENVALSLPVNENKETKTLSDLCEQDNTSHWRREKGGKCDMSKGCLITKQKK